MKTRHDVIFETAANMKTVPSGSIDLVVTSPPYPMIEMWDELFTAVNPAIGEKLKKKDGPASFELMHRVLDAVWKKIYRVLRPGGIACINIGDATRTLNENFSLYTNHARILAFLQKIGFQVLPAILWRKQTNAPNKFMGSGMMPPGAYVTLEHEYILMLRKGRKREFSTALEKQNRRESSFFWEERNTWISDVWMDLKGTRQGLFDRKTRKRSAAFPFELAYRLINMFSVKGDRVLDPFLGIGTTLYAAMAAGRNSVGFEIDIQLKDLIFSGVKDIVSFSNRRIDERFENHIAFVRERSQQKGPFKYINEPYRFPVMTRQETQLLFNEPISADLLDASTVEVTYSDVPQENYAGDWEDVMTPKPIDSGKPHRKKKRNRHTPKQRVLFS